LATKTYTLIVVPDHQSQVKRYRIQRRFLVQVLSGLAILLVMAGIGTWHYFQVARDAQENHSLREENLVLRGQLRVIRERVDHMGSTLDRVERFDQKLRSLTLLSDPRVNGGLPMGPTEGDPSSKVPGSPDGPAVARVQTSDNPRALTSRLDKLTADATRQEQSLQELQAYFQDQRLLLASVPSVWPVRGFVTSDFGQRLDPYTADRVMHAGLDIANDFGKEVISPSDGTVVFAGLEGGYGNVLVIDHGYGIKTRYGHLSKIGVKPGDHVKRGQSVAAIGNTGRSTGPHLHYEVRVNGVAQNPRKFILEE
jgi:murein DD-endopeptidase MepM/ murein hydrolase activator NlpD